MIRLSLLFLSYFEFFYWCTYAFLHTGESFSNFFSRHIQSMSSFGYKTLSSVFFSFCLFVWDTSFWILRMVQSILLGRFSWFDEISAAEIYFERFSFSKVLFFKFFFHPCVFPFFFFFFFFWLGFLIYQPLSAIECQILFIHIYWIYTIYKHILLMTLLNEPEVIFLYTVKGFQVLLCYSNN